MRLRTAALAEGGELAALEHVLIEEDRVEEAPRGQLREQVDDELECPL